MAVRDLPLLLQYKLHGKALEVVSALSVEDSLDYNKVKAAVQRSYELVPEAYRQNFRGHRKNAVQTYRTLSSQGKRGTFLTGGVLRVMLMILLLSVSLFYSKNSRKASLSACWSNQQSKSYVTFRCCCYG